jgi:hypothetical protein
MIRTAAIATFAPVLIPVRGAAAPWGASEGVATDGESAGAFDEFAVTAGVPAVGTPVVEAPHLPQNFTVSFRLEPQFLQNVLMVISTLLKGCSPDGRAGWRVAKMNG